MSYQYSRSTWNKTNAMVMTHSFLLSSVFFLNPWGCSSPSSTSRLRQSLIGRPGKEHPIKSEDETSIIQSFKPTLDAFMLQSSSWARDGGWGVWLQSMPHHTGWSAVILGLSPRRVQWAEITGFFRSKTFLIHATLWRHRKPGSFPKGRKKIPALCPQPFQMQW